MNIEEIIKAAQESYQQKFCPLVDVTGFSDEYTKQEYKLSSRDRKIIDLIATTRQAAYEAGRKEVLEWAKSNARTNDTNMSALLEDFEWTIDYRELEEFLSPNQEK